MDDVDNLSISYKKFKIIFINTYLILFKAATLNFYKLQTDLKVVEKSLQYYCDGSLGLSHQLLILLISLLLIAKFFFGYVTLAANVVAIFPILTDDQADLLLPSMISQAIENILLNPIELLLGYITFKYYVEGKMATFTIFFVKVLVKLCLGVTSLNVYSDLYNQLTTPGAAYDDSDISLLSPEFKEYLIQRLSLV